MARRAFYSFHYQEDNWRASKVRNMGVIEGNRPATDNDWETIAYGGSKAIEKWIADQMYGTSIVILLIGENTAGRKWIKYEIEKAWNDKKGLLGIYIHNLLDRNSKQSSKGRNPFEDFKIGDRKLSNIVKAYDPPFASSTNTYNYINNQLTDWIEEAIEIRGNYG